MNTVEEPDWSLLPPELIQFISKKIFCITEYVYFRAVCKRWRLASLPKPHPLPPQLPWLLLPRMLGHETVAKPEILFYDLHWSKMSTLCHPIIQGSRIKGASRGWLILEKCKKVVLLNPVTGVSIPVSSLSGVPKIFPILELSKLSPADWIITENEVGWGYMEKAILTSTPSPDSGCMVVGLFASNWIIAFCRIGHKRWTLVEKYEDAGPLIIDIAWHHNLLYAIESNGGVYIYDVSSPSKQYVVAHWPMAVARGVNLVEGDSELMAVVWRQNVVFRWKNEGQPGWHRVYDIGDDLLFRNLMAPLCISTRCANLQSSRWRGSQICSEKRSSSSGPSIELEGLRNGDSEVIVNLEVPRFSGEFYWLTPSYF